VKPEINSLINTVSMRERQGWALLWAKIAQFLASTGESPLATRERTLIRRSKTDQASEGNLAYLSAATVRYPKQWVEVAEVREGALFRREAGRLIVRRDLILRDGFVLRAATSVRHLLPGISVTMRVATFSVN
jgi:hypothetical protein